MHVFCIDPYLFYTVTIFSCVNVVLNTFNALSIEVCLLKGKFWGRNLIWAICIYSMYSIIYYDKLKIDNLPQTFCQKFEITTSFFF